ncbi:MAG: FAD-dependent oxidoreductase [Candidatus Omnitrophica bacterium]|nr:FAD-dependent oxidoreductase [Candidatus Omnitrophota bacterium]
MVEFDTEVVDVIEMTYNVKSFRFRAGDDAVFRPGQFFFVTIKAEDRDMTKHFSFSNSPTEKGYVEFTKRITGSPFSKALDGLKRGDWAHLRMPYGNFTFEGGHDRIAFLSGGIGVTPIRSMCKYAGDMKLERDIVLLYGNSEERDIIFRRDLDEISSKIKNIRVLYTLTSQDVDNSTWAGRIGYIDSKMVREEIPDYNKRIFYICGPPNMVEGLKNILRDDLGVKEGSIKYENFSGY